MIPSVKLTAAGAALLAKVPAGSGAPVTRWQIGTGVLPAGTDLTARTALAEPLKDLPIARVTNSGSQSLVLGQFVNTGMDVFGCQLIFSGETAVTAEIDRTLVFATLKDLENYYTKGETLSPETRVLLGDVNTPDEAFLALYGMAGSIVEMPPAVEPEDRRDGTYYLDRKVSYNRGVS